MRMHLIRYKRRELLSIIKDDDLGHALPSDSDVRFCWPAARRSCVQPGEATHPHRREQPFCGCLRRVLPSVMFLGLLKGTNKQPTLSLLQSVGPLVTRGALDFLSLCRCPNETLQPTSPSAQPRGISSPARTRRALDTTMRGKQEKQESRL